MILFYLLCATQTVWGETWEYYHKPSAQTIKPPTTLREDSYFGFSIAYDQYNRRIIVTAPRENNIGEVYECDLSYITDKSCSKLASNMTRDSKALNYTHDYWFGATVKASPTFVMACSPRYSIYLETCEGVGMYGRCYVREKNETYFSSSMYPTPIKPDKVKYNGKMICTKQEKKMDTLGWSLDIGEDSSVMVGSPSMFDNTGTAVIKPPDKDIFKRLEKKESMTYNIGYSVAIGHFMSENAMSYAVSTTYGTYGHGKIYFYKYDKHKLDSYITLNSGIDESVIGTMFGAVLCAAKINEYGKGDDLLVGAPTYALASGYNTGAVYVYGYNKKGDAPEFRRKIIGHKYGSLFGSAIISVGDLNGDSKDEIAIGAPFEDEGAVYLYSGASIYSTDKIFTFLQKIKPSDKGVASFGYSLAILKDYANIGCNELAIGAPFKDRVMLYKCLAAVTITKLYTVFPDVKNRTFSRQTDYIFQVCMDLQYPEKLTRIVAELSTDVKMDHLSARLKSPNKQDMYTFNTQLQSKNTTYCKNIEFVLPLDKDYSMQIGYKVTTKLQNSSIDVKNASHVPIILSDKSMLSYSGVLSAAECSGINECISNLSLTVTSDMIQPVIIGSQDQGAFHIQVLNTGEVAYDPCVQFSVSGSSVQKPPMYCSDRDEQWLCNSMKPLRINSSWEIRNVIVDLRDLTNLDKNVTLNLKLFDRCADTNHSKEYKYNVSLISYPDCIYVKGATDIGDTIHIVEREIGLPKKFKQVYKIMNKGPTNFKDLVAIVKLRKRRFITYSEVPVSIYTEATSISSRSPKVDKECEITIDNDIELVASCPIHSLFKDNYVTVVITMDTDPDVLTLDLLKKQGSVEVDSIISISFDKNTSKSYTLETLIHLQEGVVNLWILIAAGLVGLLLLILLTVVLYKSGFLRRKNKKKLQILKKDIKRQSMRRSRMSHSLPETAYMLNCEGIDQNNRICVK